MWSANDNRVSPESLIKYIRRKAVEVNIGGIPLGAEHPIRVQSMTTADTMDTEASVEESIRIIDAGADYVRLTAPSIKDAANLEVIRKELRAKGYNTPLIADIHFTPNAAELAATYVEKVRVNPGNYADKKKFETIEYTDESYKAELERIREKFEPLIRICKEHNTSMRIGTNHGSLSDRIMSRYGDTPLGMVESALEFIRICEDNGYYEIVLSMKASNPQVMVHAYRLLVDRLEQEGLKNYPLHLGVTEAGEGEDGRIKSAIGIGMLLEDGIGDTVRVSLTEAPEYEVPVAQALVDKYEGTQKETQDFDPAFYSSLEYKKRASNGVENIGGEHHVPVVIADFSEKGDLQVEELKTIGHFYYPGLDKWKTNEFGADLIYLGDHEIAFDVPGNLRVIYNQDTWMGLPQKAQEISYPLISFDDRDGAPQEHPYFLMVRMSDLDEVLSSNISQNGMLILDLGEDEGYRHARSFFVNLMKKEIRNPVIIRTGSKQTEDDPWLIDVSIAGGGPFIDGFGDGLWIHGPENINREQINNTSFSILQATRTRISKTEYISCPSCGRTLFDLQETTALVRERTDHLKGVKIAIMGCIVNGPGEMADADYGYVGSGRGKITLYRGQEVVKRAVSSENAVDELIGLIREDGVWVEPELVKENEL